MTTTPSDKALPKFGNANALWTIGPEIATRRATLADLSAQHAALDPSTRAKALEPYLPEIWRKTAALIDGANEVVNGQLNAVTKENVALRELLAEVVEHAEVTLDAKFSEPAEAMLAFSKKLRERHEELTAARAEVAQKEADYQGAMELVRETATTRDTWRRVAEEKGAEVERLKVERDIAVADRFDAVIGAREVDGQLLDAATEAATLRKHLESVIDFVHANVGAMEAQEMRDAYLKEPEPEPPGLVNYGMDSDE